MRVQRLDRVGETAAEAFEQNIECGQKSCGPENRACYFEGRVPQSEEARDQGKPLISTKTATYRVRTRARVSASTLSLHSCRSMKWSSLLASVIPRPTRPWWSS